MSYQVLITTQVWADDRKTIAVSTVIAEFPSLEKADDIAYAINRENECEPVDNFDRQALVLHSYGG